MFLLPAICFHLPRATLPRAFRTLKLIHISEGDGMNLASRNLPQKVGKRAQRTDRDIGDDIEGVASSVRLDHEVREREPSSTAVHVSTYHATIDNAQSRRYQHGGQVQQLQVCSRRLQGRLG